MTEKEAYIAFNLLQNIGSAGVERLIAKHGGIVQAWENVENKTGRDGKVVNLEEELEKAAKYRVSILTPVDKEYPKRLLDTRGHPLCLYLKGSVEALQVASVAMVGTRRSTIYGEDMAYKIARDLAGDGWCIVSGLALGIDGQSHRGALDGGGLTVGVLGSALDEFYPEENRQLARDIAKGNGAVISEFPFGRKPDQASFPQRNHVVAALAHGVLAVESPIKSGTLITAEIAANLGRTVMAVPGRVDSRTSAGCLKLIRDGATLVRNARDVEDALSEFAAFTSRVVAENRQKAEEESAEPQNSRTLAAQFSVEEAIVMRHVTQEGIAVDTLIRLTGMPVAKVNSICMGLRLKGKLRYFPGNKVALPRQ